MSWNRLDFSDIFVVGVLLGIAGVTYGLLHESDVERMTVGSGDVAYCEQCFGLRFPPTAQFLGVRRIDNARERLVHLKLLLPTADVDAFLAASPFARDKLHWPPRNAYSQDWKWWNIDSH